MSKQPTKEDNKKAPAVPFCNSSDEDLTDMEDHEGQQLATDQVIQELKEVSIQNKLKKVDKKLKKKAAKKQKNQAKKIEQANKPNKSTPKGATYDSDDASFDLVKHNREKLITKILADEDNKEFDAIERANNNAIELANNNNNDDVMILDEFEGFDDQDWEDFYVQDLGMDDGARFCVRVNSHLKLP